MARSFENLKNVVSKNPRKTKQLKNERVQLGATESDGDRETSIRLGNIVAIRGVEEQKAVV